MTRRPRSRTPPGLPSPDAAVLDGLSPEDRAALVDALAARIPDALRAIKADLLAEDANRPDADAAA